MDASQPSRRGCLYYSQVHHLTANIVRHSTVIIRFFRTSGFFHSSSHESHQDLLATSQKLGKGKPKMPHACWVTLNRPLTTIDESKSLYGMDCFYRLVLPENCMPLSRNSFVRQCSPQKEGNRLAFGKPKARLCGI